MKRLLVLVTPLLVLALVWGTIGCEKEATPGPTPTATSGPLATATPDPTPTPTAIVTATPSPTATSAPTATPAPTPSGEFRIAMSELHGQGLFPLMTSISVKKYGTLLYDWLVGSNPDNSLSTENGIAYKWEHSADYKTWTFYIREGIKFHNGNDLTAEDVKYSLQRLSDPKTKGTFARAVSAKYENIVVDDQYKLTITMKAPNLFADRDLSQAQGNEGVIYPKNYLDTNGDDYFIANPVGSGPYRFKENKLSSYIMFEATDNHFALGVPKYKTVTFYLVPEEITRIAMLKGGQADVIDVGRQTAQDLKKAGFNLFISPGGSTIFLWLSQQWVPENPLSDTRVRQALDLAMNKEAILQNLFLGQGKLVSTSYYSSATGIAPLPVKPYDPERAKQLLKEAAYPDRWVNPTLTIYSYAISPISEASSMLEAIAADWMKVGVKVVIQSTDYTTWKEKLFSHKLENGIGWQVTSPYAIASYGTSRSNSSFHTAEDPQFDSLIDAALAAGSQEEYNDLAAKISRYAYDNVLQPVFLDVGTSFATNDKVDDWDLGARAWDINTRSLVQR